MTKKRKLKRIFQIIIVILISVFLLLIILNFLLRKEIILKEEHTEALKKLFPEEHVNKIKLFKGGIISLGSAKTLCKTIYLTPHRAKLFEETPFSNETFRLLIHEATHTYQANKIPKCIKMSVLALYHQFRAFLKYGSRDMAYIYPINVSNNILNAGDYYNPEQEAEIIEDYYFLKFINGSSEELSCFDCISDECKPCKEFYSNEEIITSLESLTFEILKKYK